VAAFQELPSQDPQFEKSHRKADQILAKSPNKNWRSALTRLGTSYYQVVNPLSSWRRTTAIAPRTYLAPSHQAGVNGAT
jgi:hypothetical protein